MQKPSGRNQNSIRGIEPRTPRDSGSASVSRDPPVTSQAKATRKSSADINRTVNAFVQQANKMAIDGFPRRNEGGDEKPENFAKSKPNNPVGKTTPKQIVEMQGGYFKSRQNPSVQSKITSGANGKGKTATISFAKDAEPAPGILRKSDQSSTADFLTKKPGVQKAGQKEVRISGREPPKGNRFGSDVSRSTGVNTNYSTDETPTHRTTAANRLDYYTTSSSDDECTRPPKGPNAPLSPASKAKMWNDINKSPGPTYPGWKFRSPPEGRHLSQIGPEELSAMFKNMKVEAQAKTEDAEAAPKGQSKFSDYMRKMKTGSKFAEEISEDSLQQNMELKKMYAEQLDAMQERAWESLQALDANLKRNTESGFRTSFDKFMEGTSRMPNRLTVGELAKSRSGNFKGKDNPSKTPLQKSFAQGDVVQADDFSSDESDVMSPPSPQRLGQPSPRGKPRAKETGSSKPENPTSRMEQMLKDIRSTRKNLAQGDALQDSGATSSADSEEMSKTKPRPSGFGDSARSGANAKTNPAQDDSRSLSRVTADQFKSLAEEDPLKKLKKISEQLKLDNARMLSRRAPHAQAIKFSSSDDDSNDFDVPCMFMANPFDTPAQRSAAFPRHDAPRAQYTPTYRAAPRPQCTTSRTTYIIKGMTPGMFMANLDTRAHRRAAFPRHDAPRAQDTPTYRDDNDDSDESDDDNE